MEVVIMRKKPIIGIIGKVFPKHSDDLWHKIGEVDEIRYLIVENGGIAITLLPVEKTTIFNDNDIKDETILTKAEKDDLYRQLELCDGFILQGGLYSCNYEIEMAKKIIEMDKPLIGICAGFNNILRALGSDVILDETKTHDIYDKDYRHDINICKNTMLYDIVRESTIGVNSIHSMVATRKIVEPYATISSYSNDNLVESFEIKNKRFILGIKWHPELMIDEEYVNELFQEFIRKCCD